MSANHAAARLDTAGPDTRRESIERRILEGTQALIDGGATWHQIGIRQISERADISRTAFYDFFASKNEVLEHLIRGLYEELSQTLNEALDPGSVGRVDLRHIRPALGAAADFARRHGFTYRAFVDATAEDPHLSELWEELTNAIAALIAGGIEEARAEDPAAPRTVDAGSVAHTLMLMTERTLLIELVYDRGRATLDALVDIWEHAVFGSSPAPAA